MTDDRETGSEQRDSPTSAEDVMAKNDSKATQALMGIISVITSLSSQVYTLHVERDILQRRIKELEDRIAGNSSK